MKMGCTLLVIIAFPISALACSCPPVHHACEAFRAVPVIFTGTVTGVGPKEPSLDTRGYSRQVQFGVDESFKGMSTGSTTVTFAHVQSSCPSNAPEFVVGGRFLVWAFADTQGNLVISDCTATRRFEDAAEFISELRELRTGHGATYIFGGVYRNRVSPNGVKLEELDNYSSLPLAGTKVIVSSHDGSYTATTDEKGRFVVPLQRGDVYEVVADLPRYFDHETLGREVDLQEHDCADMSLWTQYAFLFRGRVVDIHADPVAGVTVVLLSASTLEGFAQSTTDNTGEYELAASEPGGYLIAVNWDEPPSEESPFATAFYPGVHDTKEASLLHTEEAGAVVLSDFHLPTPIKCAVQIRVENRDGKPTNEARVLTKYFPAQFWHQAAAVSNGTAAVMTVGPGPTYMVASQVLSDQVELRSEVKIVRSCPSEPIRFRLTKTMPVE
jgi:hypothetical protein